MRTSVSIACAPTSTAPRKLAMVFSGDAAAYPRCAIHWGFPFFAKVNVARAPSAYLAYIPFRGTVAKYLVWAPASPAIEDQIQPSAQRLRASLLGESPGEERWLDVFICARLDREWRGGRYRRRPCRRAQVNRAAEGLQQCFGLEHGCGLCGDTGCRDRSLAAQAVCATSLCASVQADYSYSC